ncbi:hypothetical protein [Vagococcus carniphilus]|uniref:hypothetical protein n=1 Tax=Vagococcus carniphilus TaxID=218144 RepID=UPI003BA98392
MKKKKIGLLVGLGCTTLLLASCGNSPQKEFASFIEEQNSQTVGTWDFNMAIDDMKLSEGTSSQPADPIVNMIITQVKDASIDGTVQVDMAKDIKFGLDMKMKAMGMEIPFNMIGDFGKEPKLYMATDMMEYVMTIAQSMAGGTPETQPDFSKIKGKYIDISETPTAESKKEWKELYKEVAHSKEDQKEFTKLYVDFIKGLDKKTFTKKEDVISHTFTKKEIEDLFTEIAKASEEKDADVKEVFKDFKDMTLKVDVNPKKNSMVSLVTLSPKGEKNAKSGFDSMTLKIKTNLKDKKANIKLPKKEDIISQEEFEKAMPSGAALGRDSEKISKEEFEEVKSMLTENKDTMDKEAAQEFLETQKESFTEEQYKELQELLK